MPICRMHDHPAGLIRNFPHYEGSQPLLGNVCPYCRTRPGMGETFASLPSFATVGIDPRMNQAELVRDWEISLAAFQAIVHEQGPLTPRNPSTIQQPTGSFTFPIPQSPVSLPRFEYRESLDPTCTICVDLLHPDNAENPLAIIPRCGHIFHGKCIQGYIGSNYGGLSKTCPNCRKTVIAGDYNAHPPFPIKGCAPEVITTIEYDLKIEIDKELEKQSIQTQSQPTQSQSTQFPLPVIPRTLFTRIQESIIWNCQICSKRLPPPFDCYAHKRFHCSACRVLCSSCILKPCPRGSIHVPYRS